MDWGNESYYIYLHWQILRKKNFFNGNERKALNENGKFSSLLRFFFTINECIIYPRNKLLNVNLEIVFIQIALPN